MRKRKKKLFMQASLNPSHDFHLVDQSPWPMFISTSLLNVTVSAAASMHYFTRGISVLIIAFCCFFTLFILWSKDVVREGTYLENHNIIVKSGLRFGFLLFVVSEAMLFFAFFWAFFHSSLRQQ
jgi:cytochrome c oxidase subunit 3